VAVVVVVAVADDDDDSAAGFGSAAPGLISSDLFLIVRIQTAA